jgi:uncharacterized protein (TIGR00369 family)
MRTPTSDAPSGTLERALAALLTGEYTARLRLQPARIEQDRVAVTMPFDESLINRGGRVHGGALASLLLAAGRIAVAASEGSEHDRSVRLLTANFAFLSVPCRGRLVAEADVVRRGREIAHAAAKASDEDGTTIASATLTVGLVDPGAGEDALGLRGASARARDLAGGSRVPGSPYLSAAGVLVLPPEQRSARALLPRSPNRATEPARVDEGAIAGLVDSCAAYAAHLRAPVAGDRGGVTVSMALAFHASRDEDLLGVGTVTGYVAGCHLASVEVTSAANGAAVASGFAVYRLPA